MITAEPPTIVGAESTISKAELRRIVRNSLEVMLVNVKDLAKSKRDLLSLSKEAVYNLEELPEVKSANSLFAYLSLIYEVRTHDLIWRLLNQHKIVTVPKILENNEMDAYQITDWAQVEPGRWNILEPFTETPYKGKIELCIVPIVAFNDNLQRLGKEGGFYDRFLAKHPEMLKIGLAFEQQRVEYLPTEAIDVPMDIIVTEKRILRS